MRSTEAPVGARICDSLPFSQSGTVEAARSLKAAGVDGMAGYLGVMNQARLQAVLGAGMGYLPVALAGEYNDGAADEIAQLKNLNIPQGAHVVADMEGMTAFHANPAEVIGRLNLWFSDILKGGWIPALYVGSPQPLTSDELWHLGCQLYWRGQGSVRDRNGALAEPAGCGWSMVQAYPSVTVAGFLVDHNQVSQDYLRRVPRWVVA